MQQKMAKWFAAALLAFAPSAAGQTGTFLDRLDPTDVRIASFNTAPDNIFPDNDITQAAKFERMAVAVAFSARAICSTLSPRYIRTGWSICS